MAVDHRADKKSAFVAKVRATLMAMPPEVRADMSVDDVKAPGDLDQDTLLELRRLAADAAERGPDQEAKINYCQCGAPLPASRQEALFTLKNTAALQDRAAPWAAWTTAILLHTEQPDVARFFFAKAAESELAKAQASWGFLLVDEDQDFVGGVPWLAQAARQGHGPALSFLQKMAGVGELTAVEQLAAAVADGEVQIPCYNCHMAGRPTEACIKCAGGAYYCSRKCRASNFDQHTTFCARVNRAREKRDKQRRIREAGERVAARKEAEEKRKMERAKISSTQRLADAERAYKQSQSLLRQETYAAMAKLEAKDDTDADGAHAPRTKPVGPPPGSDPLPQAKQPQPSSATTTAAIVRNILREKAVMKENAKEPIDAPRKPPQSHEN